MTLTSAIRRRVGAPESRALSPQDVWGTGGIWNASTSTYGDHNVTTVSAQRASAVFRCVDLICTSHGQLPVQITEDDAGERRPIAVQPRWLIEPNPESTWQGFVEQLDTSLLLAGNAYIQVILDRRHQVVELWPLHPERVTPRRLEEYPFVDSSLAAARTIVYDVTLEDGTFVHAVPSFSIRDRNANGAIIHMKFRHMPGQLRGINPIEYAAQSIGLSLTAEQFGANFFNNGAHASGVIEMPNTPEKEVTDRMRQEWLERHQGAGRAHLPGVVYGGAKYTQISIAPEQAQFLELRNFQVEDIARFYGVPLQMMMLTEKQSGFGTATEAGGVNFTTFAMQPHLTRLEQTFERQVLSFGRQLRHDTEALHRSDIKTRAEADRILIETGAKSINEVRRERDLPPVEGGDQHFVQTNNFSPLDRVGELVDAEIEAKKSPPALGPGNNEGAPDGQEA